jgi:hypothetical protein
LIWQAALRHLTNPFARDDGDEDTNGRENAKTQLTTLAFEALLRQEDGRPLYTNQVKL